MNQALLNILMELPLDKEIMVTAGGRTHVGTLQETPAQSKVLVLHHKDAGIPSLSAMIYIDVDQIVSFEVLAGSGE